jgi:hypothetical protein
VGTYAGSIASLANAVQITIMNMIYETVALKLTDVENPRLGPMAAIEAHQVTWCL